MGAIKDDAGMIYGVYCAGKYDLSARVDVLMSPGPKSSIPTRMSSAPLKVCVCGIDGVQDITLDIVGCEHSAASFLSD